MATDVQARLVKGILDNRHLRRRLLPSELFSEPGWEALLMLFVADAESVGMTGQTLAEETDTPPRVMSRWIQHLSQTGVIVGDGSGDLEDKLTLAPKTLTAIEAFLDQTQHAMRTYIAEVETVKNGRAPPLDQI